MQVLTGEPRAGTASQADEAGPNESASKLEGVTARLFARAREVAFETTFKGAMVYASLWSSFLFLISMSSSGLPMRVLDVLHHVKQLAFIPMYFAVVYAFIMRFGPSYKGPLGRMATLYVGVSCVSAAPVLLYFEAHGFQWWNAFARVCCLLLGATGRLYLWTAFRCSTVCVGVLTLAHTLHLYVSAADQAADFRGYQPLGGSFEGSLCNSGVLLLTASLLTPHARAWLSRALTLDRGLSLQLRELVGLERAALELAVTPDGAARWQPTFGSATSGTPALCDETTPRLEIRRRRRRRAQLPTSRPSTPWSPALSHVSEDVHEESGGRRNVGASEGGRADGERSGGAGRRTR